MTSLIYLTQKSQELLESARLEDINHLISHYKLQSYYLTVAFIALLLFIVVYSGINLWTTFYKPKKKKQTFIYNVNNLTTITDSHQFSNESNKAIRSILSERYQIQNHSMTDIELINTFQKTALKEKGVEAITLLDKSLYGRSTLHPKEQQKIQNFIQDLYLFKDKES